MEVRLKVDDEFMETLRRDFRGDKASDVTREALALLRWAANEKKAGRIIASADTNGANVHRLCLPSLEGI